jgi:hypothetical protein
MDLQTFYFRNAAWNIVYVSSGGKIFALAVDKYVHWRPEMCIYTRVIEWYTQGWNEGRGLSYLIPINPFHRRSASKHALSMNCIETKLNFTFIDAVYPSLTMQGTLLNSAPPSPMHVSLFPFVADFFWTLYCPISCCPFQADAYNVDRQTSQIALLTCFNCQQRISPTNSLYLCLSLLLSL